VNSICLLRLDLKYKPHLFAGDAHLTGKSDLYG
jgi:hypothetical protein